VSGGTGAKLGGRITEQEQRLLELVCRDGKSLRQAARDLRTTYPAVANTAYRLRIKVGATTLAHLGHIATAYGLIGTRRQCGSRGGVAMHQRNDEELCVKCRIFWRPYRREIKQRARERARAETKISGGDRVQSRDSSGIARM
jgi:hypothetical protein